MAEAKKKRVIRKPETVREKATKKTDATPKPRRLHKAAGAVKRPIGAARTIGRKEYHPIKLPDNKVGRFLTSSRRFTPRFFRDAWAELKQVTWPDRKETAKLTVAVFIFAITLSLLIGVVDFGLDKLFRELLID